MSHWSNNPELYDEITIAALPGGWRGRIESGEIELKDVPEDIRYEAAIEGEREYWAARVDEAKMRRKKI